MTSFLHDLPDDEYDIIEVVKIEASDPQLPTSYVRTFEEINSTLEYLLGEPDCWLDAPDDFKITITVEKMREAEYVALPNWEDIL